jgi:hypothetical protein
MRTDSNFPGFTGEVSLEVPGREYRGHQGADALPVGGAVIVAMISRCGAACKCYSRDGNAHCGKICDTCE